MRWPTAFQKQCKHSKSSFLEALVLTDLVSMKSFRSPNKRGTATSLDSKKKTIQYLLIAEAAPWTKPGRHPRYFYERLDGFGCILSAFDAPTHDAEAALSFLADRGFLLVDTLPFAMPYSKKKARERPAYLPLIKASHDYFLGKLHDRRVQWSDHVRVALAFEVHGSKTIEAYSGGIDLPSGRVPISEDDIAVNAAHYTCAQELRRVFQL
jgi:hypothetical protein